MNLVFITLSLFAAEPSTAEAALLKTFREEFILITPGQGKFPAEATFGEDASADRKQAARIRFKKPFEIAKYEVPQNLWEAVLGANPSRWKGPRNSVEMLSRLEAESFCAKATRKLRAAKLIEPKQIVRLPSEAEWEYCAQAGTTTRYSFGDDIALLDKYGWHTGNAAGNDPPVGAKAPNPWGLYDMHGYLWEWCADDWKDDVAELPSDGSTFAAIKAGRKESGVLRGGSWKDKADQLTSFARRKADIELRDDAVGLRCVLATEE